MGEREGMPWPRPEGRGGICHEIGLVATMADGTALVGDAWYPDEGGPFPVLLQRLPYGRTVASAPVLPSPVQLARSGYAVVSQDVRGRGDSEGCFVPFVHEAADGATTIEWAADLPFCDGRVVTYGFSYQGTCQLGAAALRPRGLRAIAPLMCAIDPYEMLYLGGCLMWEATARWAAQLATPEWAAAPVEARLEARPLAQALGDSAPPWFSDWVGREDREDGYWAAHVPDLSAIEVPAFTILGYADTFAAPTARLARLLKAETVCGPWAHMPWGTRLGDLELAGASPRVAIEAFHAFLERVLGPEADLPVLGARYFVIGGDWREAESFPGDTVPLELHASTGGEANSRHGDGHLTVDAPGGPLGDVLVSEPLVPHPGNGSAYPDLSSAEDRRDVLCYTGEVVSEALELAGSPTLRATVVADAPSFDLIASLAVVEGGLSRRVAFGARRITSFEAGAPTPVEVEMGPTAWRIGPGARLRLDLSATCYPLFAPNPQSRTSAISGAPRGEHRVATIELVEARLTLTLLSES